ncbi:MAG TPA: NAD-dependent succinate-semialdehyde dehydrogenase [Rhizomicrobium sp.]|jgi:succinate-semialdehyde dehydrogenase/glutarate-semialdehyde dehydrogenase|nr:NAD-dependent succinate-semialdehyde dehydrogenase [Rhizomicrobium sp.]
MSFTLPAPHSGHSVPTGLFIGGAWRAAKKRLPVDNPASGEVLTDIADGDEEDARAAVDAAHKAGPGWAATAPRKRAEILRACYERMVAGADWLSFLISLENGKTLADAKSEILYAADFFRWYSEEAVRVLGDTAIAPGGTNRILVEYQPIGVSLLITPWNFPAAMATRKLGPALAAGCSVILKPASETPLTAFAIAAIMHDAGVPPGVVNIVTTSRAGDIARAILHDSRVRKLSFTGSTAVGRGLLREAADQVISCAMELGGNAPFIVCADADLPDALDGAMLAKMRNGGEACTAANRFYIQRGVYREFTTGLVERMSKLKLGDGTDPQTTLGPMINEKTVNKIAGLVDDAVKKGGRLLLGGTRLNQPGYFYPPTVIADVPDNARLLKQEIFGPVAALQVFDSDEEAIAKANDTEYGLTAYLYTGDLKRGLAISEKLEAGMVGLNRGLVSDPAAPFGGVKQSGLGREGAHHGLLEFTECKYIAVNW